MDSSAYLTRHGWQGFGYSLDPTGRGITKPLLSSSKTDVLGVGKKQHDALADQWWAQAFNNSLSELDVSKKGTRGVTKIVESGAWVALRLIGARGRKWTGLYNGFVRGESLSGTLSPQTVKDEAMRDTVSGVEMANGPDVEHATSKERKRAAREERRKERKARGMPTNVHTLKPQPVLHARDPATAGRLEDKRERRRQRLDKKRQKQLGKEAAKTPVDLETEFPGDGCARMRDDNGVDGQEPRVSEAVIALPLHSPSSFTPAKVKHDLRKERTQAKDTAKTVRRTSGDLPKASAKPAKRKCKASPTR